MSPRLVLQFLGLPQVLLNEQPIAIERRKAIALLAYLAVNDIGHARQKYSRESLSALLWPDYDQAKAFSNLRKIIWEVHQAIGEGWLIADREAVYLSRDAEIDLDVARFRDLLSQAHQQNDPALRIRFFVDAGRIYRDRFLTGFSLRDAPNFDEWAFAESEELRHKLADALRVLSEDHCALGRADQAIPYARRLVTLEPLNESAHRQLMEVYVQAGKPSSALKQYQICEQILRKELNLDPQTETRALYKKILKREIKPIHVESQTEIVSPKHNLPLQLSSFIGREKEKNEIINLIANNRLVTLVGTGGIGKTRLSIQTAFALLNEFPNGIWLIELAPLSDPELISQTILNTLGLLEQADRSTVTILTDFLQAKRALLILDNCEHILQPCAQLAETLLLACPNLRILSTSRENLGVTGEMLYLVPTLTIPDSQNAELEILLHSEAVHLFIERAQSALAGFRLTQENAPAMVQICRYLDGIPLALELAAARVRGLSVEQIASRLNDRFGLLAGGRRTALPRHQTLQALIDWSHNLLSESERVLFRRLSIFTGGWSLEAAESVCVSDDLELEQVLDLLLRLVDKSLVIAKTQRAIPRYHMLETIRQYAREKLSMSEEEEMIHHKLLIYFMQLAERAEQELRGPQQVTSLDQLEIEHDNLRTALEWSLGQEGRDIEAGLWLAGHLWRFWFLRGYWSEGRKWLALPRQKSRTVAQARALGYAGIFEDDLKKAAKLYEESLVLCRELKDKPGLAHALCMKGHYVTISLRNSSTAKSLLKESLNIYRDLEDKWGIARVHFEFGLTAHFLEYDVSTARKYYETSLKLSREIGERQSMTYALNNLGNLAMEEGDMLEARTFFEESLSLARELDDKPGTVMYLTSLGEVTLGQGDYKLAIKLLEESLAIAREIGGKVFIAYALCYLGRAVRLEGDFEQAAKLQAESLVLSREGNDSEILAEALCRLGEVARLQGDYTAARSFYIEAFAIAREVDERKVIAGLIEESAALSLALGKVKQSVVLLAAAENLRRLSHRALSPVEQAEIDRNITAARAALDNKTFGTLWKQGKRKTMEQAISYALEAS